MRTIICLTTWKIKTNIHIDCLFATAYKLFQCIPKQFAQENSLRNRKCEIIVRDEQRSWTFGVHTNGKNTFIGSGWHEFSRTKCLKEGDILMFEIVSNGETPIFRFHGKFFI